MPVYRNTFVLELAQGVKAFLRLDLGLTRNQSSNEKSELAKVRQQLAARNRELARLRAVNNEGKSSQERIPIFFIVGRSKSGTNWLSAILDRHPAVLCRGEGEFFGRDYGSGQLGEAYGERQLKEHDTLLYDIPPPSSRSFYHALAESEYLRAWTGRSVWARDEATEEHLNNLTREAIYYFLGYRLSKEQLSASTKRIVGDKTPSSSTEIVREIGAICPEAKVIHLIRDGRDVAVSQMHHMWRDATAEGFWFHLTPEELDKRNRYWKAPQEMLDSGEGIFTEERLKQAAEGWKSHVEAARRDGPLLLGGNYTEVRYEGMLKTPEEEVRRLFQFLGVRSNKEVTARCLERASFERRAGGRVRGEEDPRSHQRKGIAGDWKNVFTERDKAIFKESAGDLLIKLGYETDESW